MSHSPMQLICVDESELIEVRRLLFGGTEAYLERSSLWIRGEADKNDMCGQGKQHSLAINPVSANRK